MIEVYLPVFSLKVKHFTRAELEGAPPHRVREVLALLAVGRIRVHDELWVLS